VNIFRGGLIFGHIQLKPKAKHDLKFTTFTLLWLKEKWNDFYYV